ncbi:3-oxo-Delta(4,5)-steroid 5-beta-reductase [Beta vulgaris subsp. vulgaris]|uniref:3-oxo-Delta(4,5)-steroid 5-beta-reductase n=1 Tax=Beta vulgaris subsp. vulgaris TaxID=3555 RepID=UPI00053F30F0|nr:3-oxo-Delta(4,5)-steroid 5-beta-reductase [Beta vulgaris subsp. vulgaris]
MSTTQNCALVVGVTGMAGLSIAQALRNPTAQGGPWLIYGAARRPKPTWFPSSAVDHYITFDAVNFDDTYTTLSPLSSQITHVFWAAIYVGQTEEDNIKINSIMLSNVLKVLTAHTRPIKLRHITLQTGTSQYIGPIHFTSPSDAAQHEPPFHEDMGRLPYPNFYHVLEDVVKSYGSDLTYSIHRPSIIISALTRSVYNFLLTLAVYAEICKYQNAPFKYPGNRYTWEHFCDMSDARVLGEQHVWGATNEKAKNEVFNCTNGDVFSWKKMRGFLCEEFGVEFVPLDEGGGLFDLVEEMKDKENVWDRIVEEKGLVKLKMEEITCFAAVQTVLRFNFQLVSSMNKSKEFGFLGYVDSFKSVRFWIGKLRDMKIIL